MKAKWFSMVLVAAMLVIAIIPAGAAPAPAGNGGDELIYLGGNTDNPSHPLGDTQKALQAKGFEAKVNGKTSRAPHPDVR